MSANKGYEDMFEPEVESDLTNMKIQQPKYKIGDKFIDREDFTYYVVTDVSFVEDRFLYDLDYISDGSVYWQNAELEDLEEDLEFIDEEEIDDKMKQPKYSLGDRFIHRIDKIFCYVSDIKLTDGDFFYDFEDSEKRMYRLQSVSEDDVEYLLKLIETSTLQKEEDVVDLDSQYKHGNIEPLDVMKEQGWFEGFCRGNIIKYTMRRKGSDVEDLKKVVDYAERLIDWYEENGK